MTISIKRGHDNQLIIYFPYSAERVKKIKSIQGRSWNSHLKYWSVPYSYDNLKDLIKLFINEEIVADQSLIPTIKPYKRRNARRPMLILDRRYH